MLRPIDMLKFRESIFKFYGTFENVNASESVKFLIKVYTIGYQLVFIDLGFILFWSSILISPSSKEKLQSLFVAFCYLNATFKALTFYRKRKELINIWMQFSETDFEAKDDIENE